MYVCNVTSLVHSDTVIAVFPRPSFRAIVSALWCLLVLFHSCSHTHTHTHLLHLAFVFYHVTVWMESNKLTD